MTTRRSRERSLAPRGRWGYKEWKHLPSDRLCVLGAQ